jgi:hypothetical protein
MTVLDELRDSTPEMALPVRSHCSAEGLRSPEIGPVEIDSPVIRK